MGMGQHAPLWNTRLQSREDAVSLSSCCSVSLLHAAGAMLGRMLGTASRGAGKFEVLDSWHPQDLTQCWTQRLINVNGIAWVASIFHCEVSKADGSSARDRVCASEASPCSKGDPAGAWQLSTAAGKCLC